MFYRIHQSNKELLLKVGRTSFTIAYFFLVLAFFTWCISSTLLKFKPLDYAPLLFIGIAIVSFFTQIITNRKQKKHPKFIRFSNLEQNIFFENSPNANSTACIHFTEVNDFKVKRIMRSTRRKQNTNTQFIKYYYQCILSLKDGSYLLIQQFNSEKKAQSFLNKIQHYMQIDSPTSKGIKHELPNIFSKTIVSNGRLEMIWKNKGYQALINIIFLPIFIPGIVYLVYSMVFKNANFNPGIAIAFFLIFSFIILIVAVTSFIAQRSLWRAERYTFNLVLDKNGLKLSHLNKLGRIKSILTQIPLEKLDGVKMTFLAPGVANNLNPQLEFKLTQDNTEAHIKPSWEKLKTQWNNEVLHFKSFSYIEILQLRNYLNQEINKLKH